MTAGSVSPPASPSEYQDLVGRSDCPYVFRIVEGSPPQAGAGTAVLVGLRGEHGYALTCWHNIDYHFRHVSDWVPPSGWTAGPGEAWVVALPGSIRARPRWAQDLGAAAGEPVEVCGNWSSPHQDVAVLRLPRRVVDEFDLRPAPVCFATDVVRGGVRVIVRGFDRPWAEASLALYRGNVPLLEANPFTRETIPELGSRQDLFRIDLEHPWQRGLSGGGVFHESTGVLIGIAAKVGEDPDGAPTRRHRALGFATSLNVVAAGWPGMCESCHEVTLAARDGAQILDADPRRYLEKVKETNRYLEVRGIDVAGRGAKKLALSRVYTRLHVAGTDPDRREEAGEERGADDRALHEVLGSHPHAVLVGDPGSGKTTFLRFVAQNLARAWLDGDVNALARVGLTGAAPFPILVRLSDLAQFLEKQPAPGTQADAPEHFYRYLDDTHQGQPALGLPAAYLRERVLAGGCYLLLDGLDEVPGERMRARVGRIIEQVLVDGQAVGNRHLATCRIRAYEGQTQLGGAFSTFRLAPFGREQIEEFIRGWCAALHGGEEAEEAAKANQAALLAAIDGHPHVTPLTANPLMLTVLAVVHWNQKRLPEQRAELYEAAVKWLIESRSERSEYESPLRRECLQAVALRMVEDPEGVRRTLGRLEAAEVVERLLGVNRAKALDYLDDEALHSGLLVTRLQGELEFWHLTFEEYLAACELRSLVVNGEDYWPRLTPHLHDPSWREVVLLVAGCLRSAGGLRPASGLIRRILEHNPGRLGRARAVGLIGGILRDIHAYGGKPELGTGFEEILRETLDIFEPGGEGVDERTRIEVGEALGQAGDPRLLEPERNRVFIRGGSFLMGAQKTDPDGDGYDPDAEEDEAPVHQVTVSSFLLGRYPVTVGEYRKFVEARGYEQQAHWTAEGWIWRKEKGRVEPADWKDQLTHPNRPVVAVAWYEADAYCRWAKGRLPTEAEWEWAARGEGGSKYPWGEDQPTDRHANFGYRVGSPTVVGIYPFGVTPEGVHDLAGSVLEWCADRWGTYSSEAVVDPKGPTSGPARVLRGGSFILEPAFARAASRCSAPVGGGVNEGFRCAWPALGGQQ